MSQVRFIADLHLGHEKMAEKRGFKNVEEHDNYIIEKWNSVVNKKDKVFILGDVTMESKKPYPLLDKMNGLKVVVGGNHDMPNHMEELLKYVHTVTGMIKYSRKGWPKMWLTHYPIHPSELEYRVGVNIHGHIHENVVTKEGQMMGGAPCVVEDDRYVCVSCERVNYTPQLLEDLIPKVWKG